MGRSNEQSPPGAGGGATRALILALPGVVPLDVSAAWQFLSVDLPLSGLPCRAGVCGESAGVVPTGSGFGLHVDAGAEALAQAELVLVAGTVPADPQVHPSVLESLRAAHARRVPVVAVGSAAFVLARAGLLDGRTTTTHWCHGAALARRYPKIVLDLDAAGVEDGGVYTSTGLRPALELCFRALRRARAAAEQDQPAPASPDAPDGGGARRLADVREWMVEHLDQPTSLDDLAGRAFLSRRQFTRRFRAEVGVSPWQWLIRRRLDRARHLLEQTDDQIEVISRRCGFPTALAFRTVFKQTVGTSPSQYRRSRAAAESRGCVMPLPSGDGKLTSADEEDMWSLI
jgi:transcriptional regulator GlxA family with amidase domain